LLKFNTLEGILGSFTKVQSRLDNFARKQDAKADELLEVRKSIQLEEQEARLDAETARRVSTNIVNLLSA